jgi:hypothetical protein
MASRIFKRVRKITKKRLLASSCLSLCPSARLSAPAGRICMLFDIWVFFDNLLRRIQVSLKSEKNNGYITSRHFWSYLARFFLEWEIFSDKICRENQNTRFMFNNFFPQKSCRLWDNVAKYCRAGQATDDNMAHAHCMLVTYGNKHTLRYVTLTAIPLQQWFYDRPWLLRYTYIGCLVNFGTQWTWVFRSTPRPICRLESSFCSHLTGSRMQKQQVWKLLRRKKNKYLALLGTET